MGIPDKNFSIEIHNTDMEAWLSIYDSERISLMAIRDDLTEMGIVYGIDENTLKKIEDNNFPKGQYLIAKGLLQVNGEDSRVECLIDMTPPMVSTENVSSRYFHVRLTNVRKGQRLLRFTSATEGTPGVNVFGQEVLPTEGKASPFPRGLNTAYDNEEEPMYLIAAKSGNFVYEKDQIRVEPEYKIVGDVSTVNGKLVEFYGDLIVQGDVRVGVTLKVDGNLTVTGIVEDADIECGGSVDVKGGFRGSGIGKLFAYGTVTFFHGSNYTITSRASIKVSKIAMNCNLTAKYIDSPIASICGGKVIAFTYIEVLELGKEEYTKTTVELASKITKMKLFAELDKEIEALSEKIKFCSEKVKHFKRLTANKQISRQQEEGIFSFQHTLDALNEVWDKRVKERDKLREETNKMLPKIIVNGTVFDNVKLSIKDITLENVAHMRKLTFYEKDQEIINVRNP